MDLNKISQNCNGNLARRTVRKRRRDILTESEKQTVKVREKEKESQIEKPRYSTCIPNAHKASRGQRTRLKLVLCNSSSERLIIVIFMWFT